MKKERLLIGLLAVFCLNACGSGAKVPAPASRPFPMAEVPLMIGEPSQRAAWMAHHFWDPFTALDSLYVCDSLHINGVLADEVEQQMGTFATILERIPSSEGIKGMAQLYGRISAFQEAFPSGNLFPRLNDLVIKYFYDPNSPFRNEELYLPYVSRLAGSANISPTDRLRYQRDARLCALNNPGMPATDFRFIDSYGQVRTLYSIDAALTLLIFGNPDCHACKELQAALENNESLAAAIASGQLKVVDIYIDEDVEAWKERIALYPSTWINGYDPDYVIRTDLIYNVRAVPSLYLLDAQKTVLLKDCTPEQLFEALGL